MEKDWITIFTSRDRMNMELVKQLLTENEINVVELNKTDSAYHFGRARLYVHSSDFASAIEVINRIEFSDDPQL